MSGNAGVKVSASGAITDPADTISGSVTVSDHPTGSVAITDPPDSVAGSAGVLVSAAGSVTDPSDTVTAAGSVSISATVAIIDTVDSISGTVVSGSGPAANDDLVVPLVRRRRR